MRFADFYGLLRILRVRRCAIGSLPIRGIHIPPSFIPPSRKMAGKIPDEAWKKKLSPEAYYVTRQKGTEAPFTGKYTEHFKNGNYNCVCCGALLFESDSKFKSSCGWPAFSRAAGASGADDTKTNIDRHEDLTMGLQRTEVTCKSCGAHLGHVFDDGPKPTGIRYCINSAALNFVPKDS